MERKGARTFFENAQSPLRAGENDRFPVRAVVQRHQPDKSAEIGRDFPTPFKYDRPNDKPPTR